MSAPDDARSTETTTRKLINKLKEDIRMQQAEIDNLKIDIDEMRCSMNEVRQAIVAIVRHIPPPKKSSD